MGARQSSINSSQQPQQYSCPNDVTCQNFDFLQKEFACPGAKCENGMCNCGPNCTPFEGTCCKSVTFDPNTNSWKCGKLASSTPSITKSDSCQVEVYDKNTNQWICKSTGQAVVDTTSAPITYDPNNVDVTYHPVFTAEPTVTAAPVVTSVPGTTMNPVIISNCKVSDKMYRGITIPGNQICNWYNNS